MSAQNTDLCKKMSISNMSNLQIFEWYYTLQTYDVVFIKRTETRACTLGVVAPCTVSLPDHSIYVVHFNRNYCGAGHVPHQIIHMRDCCPIDEDMKALSEIDKQHFLEMKDRDHVMNIYHRYRKLTLSKKAYVIMRVLEETKNAIDDLYKAYDLWEQRNIFDVKSTENIKMSISAKKRRQLNKQLSTQQPCKKKKTEHKGKMKEKKQKLLKLIRKTYSNKS